MHYAALAGKGIVLIQQGKVEEAQGPLKRALAIDPWLKERNLIVKDSVPNLELSLRSGLRTPARRGA